MFEKQQQNVGDNSRAIQVNGDLVVTPYQEIRAIFYDLFELNFPKIQKEAKKTADERVNEMLEQLRIAFEKHKEDIETEKFMEPGIQYEMQAIATDVARRGSKSNIDMLCELLCTITSKDCPELVELIASEARQAIPRMSPTHLSYLSLEILVNEASYQNSNSSPTPQRIDLFLSEINEHIKYANDMTVGDLQYLNCIGCINRRGIVITDVIPHFVKEVDTIKDQNFQDLLVYFKENNLENLELFFEIMEKCQIGRFSLSATGRLIGWLNLGRYSSVNVKDLF